MGQVERVIPRIYAALEDCQEDHQSTVVEVACNTPVLTPLALNVYYVYIVINHGVELKEKPPPSIWLCYVSVIEIIADGISCYLEHYSFGIM